MRLFLDANILFSAAKSDGAIRELLRRVLDAGHECCVDEFVVTEARRNLVAKSADSLAEFEALPGRLRVASILPVESTADTDWLPSKDRPVLAAAIRLRCDGLVTGDRAHFGAGYGKSFGGVKIHSALSLSQALWPS